ncbi:MAG: ribonuclease III, partial [Proteobacteria bacterium]|nr:ribonuclease III [Pseudomonadota bacterium]
IIFAGIAATGTGSKQGGGEDREVNDSSPEEAGSYLAEEAQKVVVVPGYGLAVAQAQSPMHDLMETLESQGKEVLFGIHPVAGCNSRGSPETVLREQHRPGHEQGHRDQARQGYDRNERRLRSAHPVRRQPLVPGGIRSQRNAARGLMDEADRLERRLGYRFRDRDLLKRALTHRSVNAFNNERLEFLGDAVLGMVVADFLYRREAGLTEGDLSRLRASLVNRDALALAAQQFDLGDVVRLGAGELKSGGFRRRSVLADALEAVIGAVYLDSGFAAAEALVHTVLQSQLENLPDPASLKDPKTRLQEALQERGLGLPEYATVEVSGPPHKQMFNVACRIPALGLETHANGASRRSAEQAAAEKILEEIESAA